MWLLGPHCHTVLHGYRFVDPQWEQDYQARGQPWALVTVRLYTVVAFLVACTGVAEFRRFSVRVSLVLHCLTCAATLLLLLLTFCSRHVRRNLPQVMAVACCAIALCYCYIMTDYIDIWSQLVSSQLQPALLSLLEDDAARRHVQEVIVEQACTEAVYIAVMWSFNHWLALAALGVSPTTLASFAVVFLSLSATLVVDPNVTKEVCMESIMIVALATGAFLAMSIVLERLRRTNFLNETLLTRELQASRMADSMLNHNLKNLLADVAANIEVFLAGSGPPGTLEDSVTRLRRGMVACKERQVYLKLVSGEYVPTFQEVSLRDFGHQVSSGRDVRVEAMDLSVHLDSTICSLILENALSNAFRHGAADDPQVALCIEALGAEPHTQSGFQRIRFTVENAADPIRPPLTPEDAERLFHGQAHLVSNVRTPTLSDRVGIVHCVLAAQVGGVALSLAQDGDVVRFTAEVDALVVPRPAVRCAAAWPCSGNSVLHDFPSGLRFCCLDDSKAALRLLDLHVQTWCAPSEVHLLGHSEEDVHCFVSFALQNADVVILDQHLEYSRPYYGTDLVQELCERGFPGLVCIRSANDAAEDRERFRRAGAHCCFGKDTLGCRMMEELKAAYVQHIADPPPLTLNAARATSSTSLTLPSWPPPRPRGQDGGRYKPTVTSP